MPTEILDITLKYATDGFLKTNYLEILVKFFPLLILILTDQNQNFFTLSEYHTYLINVRVNLPDLTAKNLDREQKKLILEATYKTMLNLRRQDTSDFVRETHDFAPDIEDDN
jgi:hypothetical protein